MTLIFVIQRLLKNLNPGYVIQMIVPYIQFFASILAICSIAIPNKSFGQKQDSALSFRQLKKLSLEELMNIEVTSVSKRPERLTEVASAIQVITQEDIKRSGATNLPEALRLAPNLQVAQIKSNAWIISARGFNAVFPNKLLVLIDGRTVYSPLFAGIFWDAQSVLLEDVERIEIISGPGGTLWGANAVNGVINIITKNTKSTQGIYAAAAVGSLFQYFGALRYGGTIGPSFSYRTYVQHTNYDNTFLANKTANTDSSRLTQTGFRMDWNPSELNSLLVLGNFYIAAEKTKPQQSTIDGQNILSKFTHTFSEQSELIIQAYFDRTWRTNKTTINDQLNSYDFDLQHRFPGGTRNSILWGVGYRLMLNAMQNLTPIIGFLPPKRNMHVFSAFIQDEIRLSKDNRLKLTLGSKFQHNVFSGFEIQPSVRLAWTPAEFHTLWTAVSRAVRTPSRIDVDYYIPLYPVPPTSPSVAGGPNFTSEKLLAYELGYRILPLPKLLASVAAYYNQYDDLYSVEAVPGTLTYQTQNGGMGYSWGAELAANYQVTAPWRLRGGYTYFFKKLENKPGHYADYSTLGIDPKYQFQLQSVLDLPVGFQLDIVTRYTDSLSATPYSPKVPAYLNIDIRLGWEFKGFEISFVGKSLLSEQHPEFGSSYIQRNYYGKITWRF